LTRCPDEKEVSYNSIEFLQFIRKKQSNITTGFEYGRNILYNFVDGTSFTVSQVIGNDWSQLSNNISLDVSPFNVGVLSVETSNNTFIDNYKVSFWYKVNSGSSQYRSEWKTYKMRRKCNENSFNILFVNRLGG
jgi:hypothetical protein